MQPELLPAASMTEVIRAGRHLAEAISLQFEDVPGDERQSRITQLLESHRRGEVRIDDSLAILGAGRVVAAQLLVAQNDGTTYVWPAVTDSRIAPFDALPMRRQLYQEAVRVVDESDVWIAQSLLASGDEDVSLEMHEHGFPRLTQLLFMNRPLSKPVPTIAHHPDSELIQCEQSVNFERFARTIERTYAGTLDCPELNGCRSGEQSLQGHQLSGTFDPSRWLLLRFRGTDAGLLLLTEHTEEQVWEVIYFGLVPEARGFGLGRQLLQEGLHRAQRSNAQELVLAVDERNVPAIRLYEALDFERFEQRIVHARLSRRTKSDA